MPVICTGGFQTASVIAAAIERGDCDVVSIARPLVANNDLVQVFARGQDRADEPCTYCNQCLANVIEHPLGCYEETRFPSREAMLAADHVGVRPAAVPATLPAPSPAAVDARRRTTRAVGQRRPGEPAQRPSGARCARRKIGGLLRDRQWYQLPRLLAMGRLIEIRNELREKNLHDTEEPPLEKRGDAARSRPGAARGANDRRHATTTCSFPRMGAAGCRFGRNVPLEHTRPDTANLLVPNPRVVSRELMTRDQFQPATILNLLAAAWIQFMVHDWFVHKRSTTEFIDIPTAPGDDWGAPADPRAARRCPTRRRPARRGRRPTPI